MKYELQRCTVIFFGFLTGFALNSSAQITTVDFESIPGMTFQSGNPVPESSRLSGELLNTHGLVFRSASSNAFVAVVNLGSGHATSGNNGIGGVDNMGLLSYATPFGIEFFLPSNPSTPAVTDFVAINGDLWLGTPSVTLQAFDISGNLIGSDTQVEAGQPLTLSVSQAGIHSVRLSQTDSVAWDDLRYGPLVTAPNPITLTGSALTGGNFTFNAIGLLIGKTNVLQSSTNLTSPLNWVSVSTNVASTSAASFTNSSTTEQRFFRLIQFP